MGELTSIIQGMFGWATYLNPVVFAAAVLGFLSWAVYLAGLIVFGLIVTVYLAIRKSRDHVVFGAVFLFAFAAGFTAIITLPYINAAYVKSVGTRATAVIERAMPVSEAFIGRRINSTLNYRLDLRVTAPDGTQFQTHIRQNAGPLGPMFLDGARLETGNSLIVAYVEQLPSNIVAVEEGSDAVWQTEARSIEASRAMFPPEDDTFMHLVQQRRIENFIAAYGDRADPEIIERFKAYNQDIAPQDSPLMHIIDRTYPRYEPQPEVPN